MRRIHNASFLFLVLCTLTSCRPSGALQQEQVVSDELAIRSVIAAMRHHYNNNQPDSVLRYFTKDVIVSYPGVPDMNYPAFEKAFLNMKKQTGLHTITRDSVEEIVVSQSLAMVRFSWLVQQTSQEKPGIVTKWRSRELTTWRKEKDGQWRFFRGMWYREKPVETSQ